MEPNEIQIGNHRFRLYLTEKQVLDRIHAMAGSISETYHDQLPLFISVLNGSFMLSADLLKALDFPCEIEFVKFKSYKGFSSSGNVQELIGLARSLKGRHVIILEDIVDTGKTLSHLIPELEKMELASLKVLTLFLKPEALETELQLDYVGFEIPNLFIVGYGLDYDNHGRYFKTVYQRQTPEE